jgi:hypothetical protein
MGRRRVHCHSETIKVGGGTCPHVAPETVDEHNLSKIVDFINENGSRFIFAILNEKIKKYSLNMKKIKY